MKVTIIKGPNHEKQLKKAYALVCKIVEKNVKETSEENERISRWKYENRHSF